MTRYNRGMIETGLPLVPELPATARTQDLLRAARARLHEAAVAYCAAWGHADCP
ncbi:MAG TPA: hypothetical protein VFE37_09770 [Chloroflexota bacterium]|nr:hypothetical protein [Chloroflexota bacterium]